MWPFKDKDNKVWEIASVSVYIEKPGVIHLNVMGFDGENGYKILAKKRVKVKIGEGLEEEQKKELIRKLELEDD